MSLNLINCHIDQGYDLSLFKEEGCLSFPGRVENTMRFQEVHISNNLTYPYKFIAQGLISVVCQHELDHLGSTLFMDRKAK
jgi:peptide deformylase